MANEAVLKLRMSDPIDFTVANATGIEKGVILKLVEPRTVLASSGNNDVFGGILAREKIASDGRTRAAVYLDGVFDLTMATGSTCQAGDPLVISGANAVARATDMPTFTGPQGGAVTGITRAMQSGMIVGKALEDGASAEVIEVLVGRW